MLSPGDGLLYRGIDVFHWREPFQGNRLVQVFLHYVDRNGPHADQKFDGRITLMRDETPVKPSWRARFWRACNRAYRREQKEKVLTQPRPSFENAPFYYRFSRQAGLRPGRGGGHAFNDDAYRLLQIQQLIGEPKSRNVPLGDCTGSTSCGNMDGK